MDAAILYSPFVLIVVVVALVVGGAVLIFGGRRQPPTSEKVCRSPLCRSRNPAHARHCARCGGPLE